MPPGARAVTGDLLDPKTVRILVTAYGDATTLGEAINNLIDDLLWPTAEVTRAIAAVAIASCGRHGSGSGDPNKIRVGYIGITCEAPIFTAVEKGFFKEEGLDVELVRLAPPRLEEARSLLGQFLFSRLLKLVPISGFAGGWGRIDLPGGSAEAIVASLVRLGELEPIVAVLPGHGPATTIGRERPWLEMVRSSGRLPA